MNCQFLLEWLLLYNVKDRELVLEYPFADNIHKGVPEFFADRDLTIADKNVVVPDGIYPGDIDDIGIMYPDESGEKLFFDVFKSSVNQYFISSRYDAGIFFFTFEIQDLL